MKRYDFGKKILAALCAALFFLSLIHILTELVNGLPPVVGKTKETGTSINFLPDDTIFERTRFKEDDIKSRLHETAYLNLSLIHIWNIWKNFAPGQA